MDTTHIRIAKLYGWRVQHQAARYQLRNPVGVPVGGIYRSPLQAWARCQRFTDDVPGLLDFARKQFGSASMEFTPSTGEYRFTVGGSQMVAEGHEASSILSTFILGLKQRQDDAERDARQ